MEISAILFTLAIATLVGIFVSQPYIQHRGQRASMKGQDYSALLADYDRAINTLQELDFDNALGKIPEESYAKQRADLMVKGAELLQKLDSHQLEKIGHDPEGRIEATVAAGRADAMASVLGDDALESMIATRRKMRKEKSAGFCPRCGKPILISDRFCPSCGKAIN